MFIRGGIIVIKKILIGFLAAACVLLAGERVWADTISTNGGTSSVPVKFTVDNTAFVITVPAVITPQKGADSSFAISATKMNLRPDEEIQVSIVGGCDANSVVKLVRQNTPEGKEPAYLTTTLTTSGTKIGTNNFLVGRFRDGADSTKNLVGAVTMSALAVNENTEAGEYLAMIDFKVDLKRNGN